MMQLHSSGQCTRQAGLRFLVDNRILLWLAVYARVLAQTAGVLNFIYRINLFSYHLRPVSRHSRTETVAPASARTPVLSKSSPP